MINYLDEATLQDIKAHALLSKSRLYEPNSQPWLPQYLNTNIDYIELSHKLKFSDKQPSKYDGENATVIYEMYKHIPLEVASSENFWAYLTHTAFWDYMLTRWPVEDSESTLLSRYFFGSDKSKYRNGLSRLWWYGHITYDERLDDPYKYTLIATRDQERAAILLETVQLSRNKIALFAVLDILSMIDEWKKNDQIESIVDERNVILRPLMQYVNAIGGVVIWDILTLDEAKEKLMTFINQLIDNQKIIFK